MNVNPKSGSPTLCHVGQAFGPSGASPDMCRTRDVETASAGADANSELSDLLEACPTTEDQRSDKQNHEDDRQDVGDAAGGAGDSGEPEHRRDDGDDQKDDCIAKH